MQILQGYLVRLKLDNIQDDAVCSISLQPALRRHLEIWPWLTRDICNSRLLFYLANIFLGRSRESLDALSFPTPAPLPVVFLSRVSFTHASSWSNCSDIPVLAQHRPF